jgi:hypothetical protein
MPGYPSDRTAAGNDGKDLDTIGIESKERIKRAGNPLQVALFAVTRIKVGG